MNEIEVLYKAHTNIIKMLNNRGMTEALELKKENIDEFKKDYYKKRINIKLNHLGKNIFVKFILQNRVKPNQIKDIIKECKDQEVPNKGDKLILIIKPKPPLNITKIIKEYEGVNIFCINFFQFDLMEHQLVPKHVKATDEEVREVMEREHISSRLNFPWILKTDAVIQYLDLSAGDVCKITRTSPTSGEHVTFRVVK
jgi:DNA-directed RNA polymerase subunit H (RpoH/RPB5)